MLAKIRQHVMTVLRSPNDDQPLFTESYTLSRVLEAVFPQDQQQPPEQLPPGEMFRGLWGEKLMRAIHAEVLHVTREYGRYTPHSELVHILKLLKTGAKQQVQYGRVHMHPLFTCIWDVAAAIEMGDNAFGDGDEYDRDEADVEYEYLCVLISDFVLSATSYCPLAAYDILQKYLPWILQSTLSIGPDDARVSVDIMVSFMLHRSTTHQNAGIQCRFMVLLLTQTMLGSARTGATSRQPLRALPESSTTSVVVKDQTGAASSLALRVFPVSSAARVIGEQVAQKVMNALMDLVPSLHTVRHMVAFVNTLHNTYNVFQGDATMISKYAAVAARRGHYNVHSALVTQLGARMTPEAAVILVERATLFNVNPLFFETTTMRQLFDLSHFLVADRREDCDYPVLDAQNVSLSIATLKEQVRRVNFSRQFYATDPREDRDWIDVLTRFSQNILLNPNSYVDFIAFAEFDVSMFMSVGALVTSFNLYDYDIGYDDNIDIRAVLETNVDNLNPLERVIRFTEVLPETCVPPVFTPGGQAGDFLCPITHDVLKDDDDVIVCEHCRAVMSVNGLQGWLLSLINGNHQTTVGSSCPMCRGKDKFVRCPLRTIMVPNE